MKLKDLFSGLIGLFLLTNSAWASNEAATLLMVNNPVTGKTIHRIDKHSISPLLLPGNISSGNADIGNLVSLKDITIFTAYTPKYGRELWRTDGTEKGTRLLKDTFPGPESGMNDNGNHFNRANPITSGVTPDNKAFFWSSRGNQLTLWKTDGTKEGTSTLKYFPRSAVKGQNTSYPALSLLGNRAVFLVNDGQHGQELWYSDGTRKGTGLLLDATQEIPAPNGHYPVTDGYLPHRYQQSGDHLYFLVPDTADYDYQQPKAYSLWRTDGSKTGTLKLKQFPRTRTSAPQLFHVGKQAVYYYSGALKTDQLTLWKMDISSGKHQYITTFGGDKKPVYANLSRPMEANGNLYFWRTTTDNKDSAIMELWVTGHGKTRRLFRMSDPEQLMTSRLIKRGNHLYFLAATALDADMVPDKKPTNPIALLWHIDSVASEPAVQPIALPGRSPKWYFSAGYHFSITVNGHLLLSMSDKEGKNTLLWNINPESPAKATLITKRLNSFIPLAFPQQVVEGSLLFINGNEIWRTDGTRNGSKKLIKFNPDGKTLPSKLHHLGIRWPQVKPTRLNQQLFFSLTNQQHGTELWAYDQGTQQFRLVKDINNIATTTDLSSLVQSGKYWYFKHKDQLWISDGTSAGTKEITLFPKQYGEIRNMVASRTGQYLYILTRPKYNPLKPLGPATLWQLSGTRITKLNTFTTQYNFQLFPAHSGAYLLQNHTDGTKQLSYQLWLASNESNELTSLITSNKQTASYSQFSIYAAMTEGFLYYEPLHRNQSKNLLFFDEPTKKIIDTGTHAGPYRGIYQTTQRTLGLAHPSASTPAVIHQFDLKQKKFLPLTRLPANKHQMHDQISAMATQHGLFLLQMKHDLSTTLWHLGDNQHSLRRVRDFPTTQWVSFTRHTSSKQVYMNVKKRDQPHFSFKGEYSTLWQSDGTAAGTYKVADRMKAEPEF